MAMGLAMDEYRVAHGTYANGVRFHSPGFAATPRTLGLARQPNAVTPTGLHNRPTSMAVLVMDKRLVGGQRGFVKPRWGLDARGLVTQGAPLARRPWALECNAVGVKTFSCGHDRSVDAIRWPIRCHSMCAAMWLAMYMAPGMNDWALKLHEWSTGWLRFFYRPRENFVPIKDESYVQAL